MPNDPKLSDRGVRRGTCMGGGKAAAEAGAVTHGAVRYSACLGVAAVGIMLANPLVGDVRRGSSDSGEERLSKASVLCEELVGRELHALPVRVSLPTGKL